MHQAVISNARKERLLEMRKIEETGCKIRVFRGRAMLVQADVFFLEKNYISAFEMYFNGFLTVALYGNSRTNVDLFADLYYFSSDPKNGLNRQKKISECLHQSEECMAIRNNYIRQWEQERVSREYDYFLADLKVKST